MHLSSAHDSFQIEVACRHLCINMLCAFFFFVRSGGLYRWELRRKLFFASLNPNCLYHTLELDTITELSFSRWGLKSTKGDSGVPTDLTSYKHIMPSTQSTLPGKKKLHAWADFLFGAFHYFTFAGFMDKLLKKQNIMRKPEHFKEVKMEWWLIFNIGLDENPIYSS